MINTKIRKAKPEEIDYLIKNKGTFGGFHTFLDTKLQNVKTLVAFEEKKVVGFVQFVNIACDTWEIISIGRYLQYSWLGIGNELLKKAITNLKKKKHHYFFNKNKNHKSFFYKTRF